MDFIKADEIRDLFHDYGIEQEKPDDDHVTLHMQGGESVQYLSVSMSGNDPGRSPTSAEQQTVTAEQLPSIVEHLLNKLHHNQMVLVPVGKWRSIFDIVAFSLAENEEWQRIRRRRFGGAQQSRSTAGQFRRLALARRTIQGTCFATRIVPIKA